MIITFLAFSRIWCFFKKLRNESIEEIETMYALSALRFEQSAMHVAELDEFILLRRALIGKT